VLPAASVAGNPPRYLQEIDILATVTTHTDDGIEPVIRGGDLSGLDWTGVRLVEEDVRPDFAGTFTRQRFYRGARWMERRSTFSVLPTDALGRPLGPRLIADAGTDDEWRPDDDGFVRRFVARQIATGCRQVQGALDCTGATFTAQALVQLRHALHPQRRAREIPPEATHLELFWTEDDGHSPRVIPLSRAAPGTLSHGYGFEVSLVESSTPANGRFYVPGERIQLRVLFRDGSGRRLHPEGSLPGYGQFLRGEISSGLRYFDIPLLVPTLYYALKHRESNLSTTLQGPLERLHIPEHVLGLDELFQPQIPVATATRDEGYTALAQGLPPFSVSLGCLTTPEVCDTPLSDVITWTVPADALPGTYLASIRARREYGGEALNRGTTLELQVGSEVPSVFTPRTGRCDTCHQGPSSLGAILHGLSDRRSCFGCHGGLSFEPDNFLDHRVHAIHDRSERFPGDVRNCTLCHLTPPQGPARGFLMHPLP
jgi:hypothetical protein